MQSNGCIYLIINKINNAKYIGQHCEPSITKRWNEHLSRAKNGKVNKYLYNAMRHYGIENFIIEKIGEFPIKSLGKMEAYYAEQYGSYYWDPEPGYNMVWCGGNNNKGIKPSLETRKKMSESSPWKGKIVEAAVKTWTGSHHSEETKKKMSENSPKAMLGKKHTQESIDKMIKSRTGSKRSEETKKKMSEANLRRWKLYKEQGIGNIGKKSKD